MMHFKSLFFCACLLLIVPCSAKDGVLLKPTGNKAGEPVGLVMVQGAQIDSDAYAPLLQQLQKSFPRPLFVFIPQFILSTPEPLQFNSKMTESLEQLAAAGLPSDAKIYYAGHSLGTVFLQDYVFSHAKDANMGGMILMGGSLLRKYRGPNGNTFPVPTLTQSGTLDGLYRIFRQAETYYHYQKNAADRAMAVVEFPVVVYEGVTHMQFASGSVPYLVKKDDLKPEVGEAEAHAMLANTISAFMQVRLGDVKAGSPAHLQLQTEVRAAGEKLEPLVYALEQEAYPHFKPACNSDSVLPSYCPEYKHYPDNKGDNKRQDGCACGTPWSEVAQVIMGGLEDSHFSVVATDAVHSVSDVHPIHLPHIWDNSTRTIKVTTVTEPIYSKLDTFDTGYSFVSASELRVKLKSRQSMHEAAGLPADFHELDELTNICGDINEQAYQWALKRASNIAMKRFKSRGQPLEMGKDQFLSNAGPAWILNPLKFDESGSRDKVTISAPCSHTPTDYILNSAAGYHYCKLLSPARALEWIYLDGLRAKNSL